MRVICLCLIWFGLTPVAGAEEALGRLFYTPEQRAVLDIARRNTPLHAMPDAADRPGISLGGVVTRSDGQRSVWVNGKLEHEKIQSRSKTPGQLKLKLPEGGVELKVGQSLDPTTGQVSESYRRVQPPIEKNPPSPPSAAAPAAKPPLSEARDDETEPRPR